MPTHIENLSADLRNRRDELTTEIKAIDAAISALGPQAKAASRTPYDRRAQKVRNALQAGPLSRADLRKAVGVPDTELTLAIDQAMYEGSVERTGHARGTRYVLCAATTTGRA